MNKLKKTITFFLVIGASICSFSQVNCDKALVYKDKIKINHRNAYAAHYFALKCECVDNGAISDEQEIQLIEGMEHNRKSFQTYGGNLSELGSLPNKCKRRSPNSNKKKLNYVGANRNSLDFANKLNNSGNSTQNISSTKRIKTAKQIYSEHQKNMNIQYNGQNLLNQGNYLAAAQHYASNGYATQAYASVGAHVASEIIDVFKQAKQAKIERNSKNLQSSIQTLNEYNKQILKALENKNYKEFISLDNKTISVEKNILEYANFLNKKTNNDYSKLKREIKNNYEKRVRQAINYMTHYFIEELNSKYNDEAIEVYNNYISKLESKKLNYEYDELFISEKKAYWRMMFGNNKIGKSILDDYRKCKLYYTSKFNNDEIKSLILNINLPYPSRYALFTWVIDLNSIEYEKSAVFYFNHYNLNPHYNVQNIWKKYKKPLALHKYLNGLIHNNHLIKKYVRQIKKETGLKEKELFYQRKDCLRANCKNTKEDRLSENTNAFYTQYKETLKLIDTNKEEFIQKSYSILNEFHNVLEKHPKLESQIYYNLGVVNSQLGNNKIAKINYEKAIKFNNQNENAYINMAYLILADEVKITEDINNLGYSIEDKKREDELNEQIKLIYKSAMVYLEKALLINKSNKDVKNTLISIYIALDKKEKLKRLGYNPTNISIGNNLVKSDNKKDFGNDAKDSKSNNIKTFNKAAEYHNNQNYTDAFPLFQQLADNNYTDSFELLASYYYFGLGINQNINKAIFYYGKSAESGNLESNHFIGYIYKYGKNEVKRDCKKAIYWFQKGADKNYPKSISSLASMYYDGECVKKDTKKGIKLYKQAAELGDSSAKFALEYTVKE